MRPLRTLIPVALGMLALLGFAASSASAGAKVCSTSEDTAEKEPFVNCKAGHGRVYTGTYQAKGETGLTVTTAGGGDILTVTANSEIEGVINGTTGTGNITKLLMTNASSASCPSGVTATTNASEETPYHLTATTDEVLENTSGKLDITALEGYATPTFKLDCNVFGIHTICEWSTPNATLTVDGSDTEPRITANNVPLTRSAGPESACGATVDWISNMRFTTPSSLFIE